MALKHLKSLKKSHANTPYILLADINTPHMDGLEMLRKSRVDSHFSKNMIFSFSNSTSDEQKLKAYDLNITGYISKDSVGKNFHRLVSIINHHWQVKNEG